MRKFVKSKLFAVKKVCEEKFYGEEIILVSFKNYSDKFIRKLTNSQLLRREKLHASDKYFRRESFKLFCNKLFTNFRRKTFKSL